MAFPEGALSDLNDLRFFAAVEIPNRAGRCAALEQHDVLVEHLEYERLAATTGAVIE